MAINRCGFMTLETGGILLGWLGIIGCIIQFMRVFLESLNIYDMMHYGLNRDDKISIMIAELVVSSIAAILVMTGSILLILGVKKRKHRYIIPYLVLNSLGIVGIAYSTLELLYTLGTSTFSEKVFHSFGVTLSFLLFTIYAFLCMLALYKKFKNEEQVKLGNMHVRMTDDYGS